MAFLSFGDTRCHAEGCKARATGTQPLTFTQDYDPEQPRVLRVRFGLCSQHREQLARALGRHEQWRAEQLPGRR